MSMSAELARLRHNIHFSSSTLKLFP